MTAPAADRSGDLLLRLRELHPEVTEERTEDPAPASVVDPPPPDSPARERQEAARSPLAERNAALERENSALRTEHALIRRALANKEVCDEVRTALAVLDFVARQNRFRGAWGSWVHPFLGALAEEAGKSPKALGRHIARLAALGVIEREERPGRKQVDQRGRTYQVNEVWIYADDPASVLRRLADAQPIADAETVGAGRTRNHGGRRMTCPTCGDVEAVIRYHCPHCDRPLAGASESHLGFHSPDLPTPVDGSTRADTSERHLGPLTTVGGGQDVPASPTGGRQFWEPFRRAGSAKHDDLHSPAVAGATLRYDPERAAGSAACARSIVPGLPGPGPPA